ncbi:MAG TPA: DUF5709 domain-containing protein [Rugosimonospora sp.]|nr:DUF5709 domain-containing protein [Rugosimonospora sp.]
MAKHRGWYDSDPVPPEGPAEETAGTVADDNSNAYDDGPPRHADGPDEAALPPDRDSGPLAVDEFGTTAEEQRQGEPLDLRLSRERADPTLDRVPLDDTDPLLFEADALLEEPIEPAVGSAVSMYDRPEPGVPDLTPVGRLTRPDEGAHEDDEATEVAVDTGAAGGGASAEELAIHRVPPEQLG